MAAPSGLRRTARLRLEPVAPGHAGDWGGLSCLAAADGVTRRIASALPGDGWARDRLELGWTVRSALWGRGYATEIGRAGLAFAFEVRAAEDDAPFALYAVTRPSGAATR